MSNRDDIRKALLSGKSEFKSKSVTVCGIDVEVRQPSVKSRRDLMKRATNEDGVIDTGEFLVWSVIFNTFVPDSKELVFEPADYDALVEKPVGGFMDGIAEVAAEMMNVDSDLKAEAKN